MTRRLVEYEDWVEQGRHAGWKPTVLAKLCGVSLRQLERVVRDQFGQSPGEKLRAVRMNLAREYILAGHSNKAVAIELVFASEAHFCREFKRANRICPGEMRRLAMANVGLVFRSLNTDVAVRQQNVAFVQ